MKDFLDIHTDFSLYDSVSLDDLVKSGELKFVPGESKTAQIINARDTRLVHHDCCFCVLSMAVLSPVALCFTLIIKKLFPQVINVTMFVLLFLEMDMVWSTFDYIDTFRHKMKC